MENETNEIDVLTLPFEERATLAKKAFEDLQEKYGVDITPQVMPFNNITDRFNGTRNYQGTDEVAGSAGSADGAGAGSTE